MNGSNYKSFIFNIYTVAALATSVSGQFNFEVEKRVLERLDFYLGDSITSAQIIENFHLNDGFPNNMDARDLDLFNSLAFSLSQPLVYMGREDGLFAGYTWPNAGTTREPGNSGYSIDNISMKKHLNNCIDRKTGNATQCLLAPGSDVIACKDGLGDESGLCEHIEICPNQPECETNDQACETQTKWCHQYSIEKIPENATDRGYVPRMIGCINEKGKFAEINVLDRNGNDRDSSELFTCTYDNGLPVQRKTLGDFAACGGNGAVCDTAFVGTFRSVAYDPRYRPWYIKAKQEQRPVWTAPYPFATSAKLGITYAHPYYSYDDTTNRTILTGVIGVDYRFEDLTSFLVKNYKNITTAVAIYEEADPEYLIAVSTGSLAAELFLKKDKSVPCPIDAREDGVHGECTPVRRSIKDLKGSPMDSVLVKAANVHSEAAYPQELLSFQVDNEVDSGFFVSQSAIYRQGGTLSWRVVVVSPGVTSETDALKAGQPLFSVVIIVATIGIMICSFFFWVIYSKRQEREIMYCDWRFTCAFIFGCVLLNMSSLLLLGENNDELCLARMWTFHLCFAIALSPLFIKVWRIWKLLDTKTRFRKTTISNAMALAYTIPFIFCQMVILLIFTFVDPPVQSEIINLEGGAFVQHIVCDTDSNAFLITVSVFEVGLIALGCVLSYLTRNLQDEFGEAKQLIFSMYNIAFIALILFLVNQITELDGHGSKLLQTIGVFWATIFSSGVFVIPRLLQVRKVHKQNNKAAHDSKGTNHRVVVTGLEEPPETHSSSLGTLHESRNTELDLEGIRDDKKDNGESHNFNQSKSKESVMRRIDSVGNVHRLAAERGKT